MNHKRKKRHNSASCGLCKPGKREGVPRKNRKYFIGKQIDKEIKEL